MTINLPKEADTKVSYFKNFLAFISSVYVVFILVNLVKYACGAWFPDFISDDFLENFNLLVTYVNPEMSEKSAFFAGVLGFPIIYFFMLCIVEKLNLKNPNLCKTAVLGEFLLTGILLVLCVANIDKDAFNYLYAGLKNVWGYIPGYVVIILGVFVYKTFQNRIRVITNIVAAIMLVSVLYVIFKLYYTPAYDFTEAAVMHFSSYFAPIYKVYSGQTAGVDFTNLYGFYLYFYDAIFKLFNNASISFFSIINSVLVCLSIVFVAITIFFNTKNQFIALTFFLAYVYLYNIANVFSTQSVFFLQFMPHRVFFITAILALASVYLKANRTFTKTFLEIVGYLVSFVAIIWNSESGYIVLAGWSFFVVYLKFCNRRIGNEKNLLKSLFPYIAAPIATLFLAFTVIELITFFRSGQWLDFGKSFYFQALFYKSGYYMLPMPLLSHPWLLVVLLYAIAATKPLKELVELYQGAQTDFCKKNSMYILLVLVGIGIFVYYQGRSYILNLFITSFPLCIILAFWLDEWLDKIKSVSGFLSVSYVLKLMLVLLPVAYFSLSCLYCVFVKNPNRVFDYVKENTAASGICMQNYKFIKENANTGQKLDIITLDAGMLYSMLKQSDTLKFNTVIDWSDKEQYNKIFNYLKKSKNMLVLDRYTINNLNMYEKNSTESLLKPENYILKAFDKNLYIFENKK